MDLDSNNKVALPAQSCLAAAVLGAGPRRQAHGPALGDGLTIPPRVSWSDSLSGVPGVSGGIGGGLSGMQVWLQGAAQVPQ